MSQQYSNELLQFLQASQTETQQMSDPNTDLINKNKASALEILLKLQSSLRMAASTQVDKVTLVTRTEEL